MHQNKANLIKRYKIRAHKNKFLMLIKNKDNYLCKHYIYICNDFDTNACQKLYVIDIGFLYYLIKKLYLSANIKCATHCPFLCIQMKVYLIDYTCYINVFITAIIHYIEIFFQNLLNYCACRLKTNINFIKIYYFQ